MWMNGVLACLAVLGQVVPTYQQLLGGGCFLEGIYPPEMVAQNYRDVYPVRSSPPVQGVHLALKGSTAVKVVWMNPTAWSEEKTFDPQCQYGVVKSSLVLNVTGTAYSYPDGDFVWTLNSAVLNLTKLPPRSPRYFYRCGDPKFGWSDVLNFTIQSPFPSQTYPTNLQSESVIKMTSEPEPAIAIIGDMGVKHGEHTMASLTKRTASGEIKMLVHSGDICYANKYGSKTHNNSWVWVEYMNRLQPVVSRVPYMTTPGNHESQFAFAAYLNWLKMPTEESGSASPFWYSFDYMGIHFLAYSTEHDFSPNSTQYRWIQQDLEKANGNRHNVPWIMMFAHRPLYCSSLVCYERCEVEAPRFRGYLEELINQQKVDVFMGAHNHQYERSYPVYKEKVTQKTYDNPKTPVYVVNGGAGNPELNDPTFQPSTSWRAFGEATFDTGFLLVRPSATSLRFEYYLSKDDKMIDTFTITKTG